MGNQQKPKEKNCRITMFEEYEHVSYNSTRTFTKKKKMPLENDHHMIKVETKRKKERRYQMLYIFHTYAPCFFVVGLLSLYSSYL